MQNFPVMTVSQILSMTYPQYHFTPCLVLTCVCEQPTGVSSPSHAAVPPFSCHCSWLCPPLIENTARKLSLQARQLQQPSNTFFTNLAYSNIPFLIFVPVVWSPHFPTLLSQSADFADFLSVIEYWVANYHQNTSTDDLCHFLTTRRVHWCI